MTDKNSYQLKELTWVNLRESCVKHKWQTNVNERKRVNNSSYKRKCIPIFFCLGELKGSEYIRRVKNFVSLLTSYRAFFAYKQVYYP